MSALLCLHPSITHIAPPVLAQMEGKPIECVAHGCDHQREPYGGMVQTYTCTRCGDSYDWDVS